MFPIGRLPVSLLSAVLDQQNFCEWLALHRASKSFRRAINERGLFPRKFSAATAEMHICGREGNLPQDAQNLEILAHGMTVKLWDMAGWEVRIQSEDNTVRLTIRPFEKMSIWTVSFDRLIGCLRRSRVTIGDHLEITQNYTRCTDGLGCSSSSRPGPIDVSPFFRWLATVNALDVWGDGYDYTRRWWNVFRKIRLNYRGSLDQLVLYGGFVTDAAWHDADEMRDFWCGWTFGERSSPVIKLSCVYSIEGVGLLTDLVICPARVQQRGLVHLIEAVRYWELDDPDNDDDPQAIKPAKCLEHLARRLEHDHDGFMEGVDGIEAERMKQWVDNALEDSQRPTALQFFQICVYGKSFHVASVWQPSDGISLHAQLLIYIFDN